ncbi:MAG: NifB/NifX family molybdenum-iron cluster-binding protein [Desulfocapsaceae bacterium]
MKRLKVAMTVWGNRISPVFDSAQTILLADIEDGRIVGRRREFLPRMVAPGLARMVAEKGIDTLICGAISERPSQIIKQSGIKLLSFVGGNAEHFLEAYAEGGPLELFRMPGCCNRGGNPVSFNGSVPKGVESES